MKVEINNEIQWREDHWKKIKQAYANARYFHLYSDYLDALYKKEWDLLFDLDFKTLKMVIDWLGIKIQIVRESELNVKGSSTERLLNACKAVGADTYVSGIGGRNYLDENLFEKMGIRLEYQSYLATPYKQRFTDSFIPDLSVLDLLVNAGPESMQIIRGKQVEEIKN